ncbi:HTH-type transcriptional regulator ArgP [Diaphorobacter sp. C33]|uniref:LysR family transcriptional regulator (Chromosome initiation inhibitor) n=1 Tax=Diaphorobacter nitroreducens TaxID=164759 RepID=A0AAX1WU74_9BURK|nr:MULTISPECIES: HTH-type transcriptional regulator ArgP [Diaphorobacter]ROR47258.1 LysR family transcriptional regulator (chromosome initiation inhibitor) [Diaphorobacter nitroreducens]WKK87995.1 HTH-type transcriptional regulator ArgP [Diaphorobacter sp. C33]
MLDYAGLEALAAVVREGSFERAARRLHVTPSAVSQRIKQLEERVGQVLVQRGSPCTGTDAGRRLCLHLEQVALLENQLRRTNPDLLPDMPAPAPTLKLAVNADSLSTWFMDAMAAFTAGGNELLDLRIDDQEHTGERLRQGEVIAAVTATGTAIAGCNTWPLGTMRYVAAASPGFIARHFADGVTAATLARAPIMTFDRKDRLQDQWMQAHGLTSRTHAPRHFLPSNFGYVRACEVGMGWGMHPLTLIGQQLTEGRLVQLLPNTAMDVPLYWAHPRTAQVALERLTQCVMAAARQWLEPPLAA